MFVKPATGLRVVDPVTLQPLPAEGAEVPDDSSYWHRRIRSGDVALAKPAAEVPAKKSTKKDGEP